MGSRKKKKVEWWIGAFLTICVVIQLALPGGSRALTLDEAVSEAMQNNNLLKKNRYLSLSQRETMKAKKSEFYPKGDLTYSLTREERDVFFSGRTTSVFAGAVTFNLFRGFIDWNNLKKERNLYKAQIFQEKAVKEDILLEVKKAYISILKSEKNLEVAKEAVDLLTSQRRDVSLRYKEGLIAKNDLLKVELDLASAKQDLLARKSDLVIARNSLERVMGRRLGAEENLEVPPLGRVVTLDEAQLRNMMHKERSEIKYLRSLRESKKSALSSIKGEYYPSVDLSVTYAHLGDNLLPTGRSGLFQIDESLQGEVTISWNIFDGFRKRHEKASKKMDMLSVEEDIRDTGKELDLQLDRALEEYRINSSNLTVSEKAVAQAEENYRITNQQFKQNVSTNTDLLDARVFLSRARTQHNNALYDLFVSKATIERVVEAPLKGDGEK